MDTFRIAVGLGILGSCLLNAGCERNDAGLGAVDATDSGNVVESLRIGALDGPAALTRVGDILPHPDGKIWVVQPENQEIAVFDVKGQRLGSVGRAGQGPGEFGYPGSIGWWRGQSDTVWVADWTSYRVNLYTAEGKFVRSMPTPRFEYKEDLVVTWGRLHVNDTLAVVPAEFRPGVDLRPGIPIVAYDPIHSVVLNEIAVLDRTSVVQMKWSGGGATTVHPISDAPIVAYGADRVVVVDRTQPHEAPGKLAIDVYTAEGAGVWTREYLYDPVPLPSDEADSLIAARIPGFQRFAAMRGTISQDEAANVYRRAVVAPAYRPAVRSVHVDGQSQIWLQWGSAPGVPVPWWQLGSDGEVERTFVAAKPLDVRAIAEDWLWAVETDELDVPYIVRYRAGDPSN